MLASLIATCKMSDVNPIDYIAQTLRAILDGHPRSRIEGTSCPGASTGRQASPRRGSGRRLRRKTGAFPSPLSSDAIASRRVR